MSGTEIVKEDIGDTRNGVTQKVMGCTLDEVGDETTDIVWIKKHGLFKLQKRWVQTLVLPSAV